MKLEGQVALVTGASRGLGLAIARALGAEGAAVACVARLGPDLDAAVAALAATGITAIAAPADVTRDAEVAAAAAAKSDQPITLERELDRGTYFVRLRPADAAHNNVRDKYSFRVRVR